MRPVPDPSKLTGEFLVLGEGERDAEFINHLLSTRRIETSLYAHFVGGQSGFGDLLEAYSALPGWHKLKGVLLISDNDASSNKSFQKVKDQLDAGNFPSPPRALEIARKRDMPSLAVLMMPYPGVDGSMDGCLETLTIPALESADPHAFGCVNELLRQMKVAEWPKKGSRDKLKVRCNISVRWADDPMLGFQLAFGKGLIPLNHAIFNDVADILTNLKAWFESGRPWQEWRERNLPRPA